MLVCLTLPTCLTRRCRAAPRFFSQVLLPGSSPRFILQERRQNSRLLFHDRAAWSGSALLPEPERPRQINRQGKDDGRALFTGDIEQRTEVAKLHGLGPPGEDLARLGQPLGGLQLTLGVDDFGTP